MPVGGNNAAVSGKGSSPFKAKRKIPIGVRPRNSLYFPWFYKGEIKEGAIHVSPIPIGTLVSSNKRETQGFQEQFS